MQVTISAEGNHDPAGHHLVVVNNRCMLMDLSAIAGGMHDPSIARVEWGMVHNGSDVVPGGTVTRVDGSKSTYFDIQAIMPYVTAFEAKWAESHAAAAQPAS